MKTKPTYQELEKENDILRKEFETKKKELQKNILYFDNILMSSTQMSIAATDIDLNIILFNPQAEVIYGYKASEVTGKNLTEISAMFNVKFSKIEKAINIVRTKGSYEYWVNSETPEGVKNLNSKVSGIWDKEKNLIGFVMFTHDLTEQVNSQKEINKLTTAVEQSSNIIMITDIEGNIEYVNSKFKQTTGYSFDEVIGKNPRILKSGKQKKEVYENLWQTITSGKIWEGEFENITKSGGIYWEKCVITPLKDKKNKIINFLAVKTIITEQRRAEQLYYTTINSLSEPLHLIDKEFNIVFINKAFKEMLKKTGVPIPTIGKKIYEAFDIPFEKITEEYKQVFSEGRELVTQEVNIINDYEIHTITKKTPIIENGKVEKIITTLSNITDQKKADQALKESEARYKNIYNSGAVGIVLAGKNSQILAANPVFCKMLGYKEEELKTKTFINLTYPDDVEVSINFMKNRLQQK